MKNKICGECVHFDGRASCWHRHRGTWGGCEACSEYTERNKPTNGDRIRQMSDEELAEYFIQKNLINLWVTPFIKYGKNTKEEAIESTLAELRKEVKDE